MHLFYLSLPLQFQFNLAALTHFAIKNAFYPERIIIYRDGISDGQLPVVISSELEQVIQGIKLVKPEYK